MDGNRRFAKSKGKSNFYGHRSGHIALIKIVKHCVSLSLKSLTVYAFSSENWARPKKEVDALMLLFSTAIKHNTKLFVKNNIKFKVIGDVSKFSVKLQKQIKILENKTKNNTALTLNVAANYGGKWDIVDASKKLAEQVQQGLLNPEDITENSINKIISLNEQPEVDLLIRTGGDQRISNYLLWQCAYSEFYFTDVLWPEFDNNELDKAITEFQRRTRKFGGS